MKTTIAFIFLFVLMMSTGGVRAQCDSCVVDSVGILQLVPDPRPYCCDAESYDCSQWEDCIRFEVGGGSNPKPEFYFFIPSDIVEDGEQVTLTFWLMDVHRQTTVVLQKIIGDNVREETSWTKKRTYKRERPGMHERWIERKVKSDVGSEETLYQMRIELKTGGNTYLFHTTEFQLVFRE